MKNNTTLLVAILFGFIAFGQETTTCVQGDCKEGFGIIENSDKSIVITGFFKDDKLNGAGYKKDKNGNYIFSNFKNGIPTGNSVYYIGEGSRQHGLFENGLKEGVHILIIDSLFNESTQITYKNDKEISRKKFNFQGNNITKDCQGNCENGYGVKLDESGNSLIGFFENSVFKRGEVLSSKENICNIYCKNNSEIQMGIYSISNNKGTIIESIEVMNYNETMKIQNNINKIMIVQELNKIMAMDYLTNNEVKNTFKNF